MSKKLKGKDILLAFLYYQGTTDKVCEPIVGKTRITKMMYIFEQEMKSKFSNLEDGELFEFFAYNYGPYSKELMENIAFFESISFIDAEETDELMIPDEIEDMLSDLNDSVGYGAEILLEEVDIPNQIRYKLTDRGRMYFEDKILNELSEEQQKLLINFKRKINSLSLDQILSYVYNKYPDSTEKSVIKEKYLRKGE